MGSNDSILLEEVLKQRKIDLAPEYSASEFFELFTCSELLKNRDLSFDEIEAGIVDQGGDGGIDAIFTFVNGELATEETEFADSKSNFHVDLYIIQAKTTDGFSEAPLDRLLSSTRDLFNFSTSIDSLRAVYNAELLSAVEVFRRTYQELASHFPELHVNYFYCSKAGKDPHPNVERKVEPLREKVRELFSNAKFNFEFYGARRLLEISRKKKRTSFDLAITETPISTKGGYICLVALKSFFDLITDESGELLKGVFEANIRDYQRNTEVNQEIRDTLTGKGKEDFWWLNNGVTMLCSRAALSGKTLTLEDIEIVNGLQTSNEIYACFKDGGQSADVRHVLVRIVETTDQVVRDKIIKATNSQNAITPAQLRATDTIQRDIESYLAGKGLFYDRRKNYYRNLGKPRKHILGIPWLAQAIDAILLQEPHQARSRPASLVKEPKRYERIFDKKFPMSLYHSIAVAMKKVEAFMRKEKANGIPGDFLYHLAMYATAKKLGKVQPSPKDFEQEDSIDFQNAFLKECLAEVKSVFDSIKTETGRSENQIAKSSDVTKKLQALLINTNTAE